MASIQQLLRRSQQDRTQVAGPLSNAPKLQAVINAGGRYTVQTQQAGKNKWQHLAEGLSTINPMLQNYVAASELDAQMYEAEFARISPEERLKQLKQREEELDKKVRKGVIPFLGSPLNWKRKRRAVGKSAHDSWQQQITGRLQEPVQGDDDLSVAQIIEDETSKFIEDNPELSKADNQYIHEGFQEAINPTVKTLHAQYDAQKANDTKKKVLVEQANVFYRWFKEKGKQRQLNTTTKKGGGADTTGVEEVQALEVESTGIDDEQLALKKAWDGTVGTFSTEEQQAVISSVAKSLAAVDEMAAYDFVDYARENLRVGNAPLNEQAADTLEKIIENIAEREKDNDKKDREDKVELYGKEFTVLLNRIQGTGEAEYNGVVYKKDENGEMKLYTAFQNNVNQDPDITYAADALKVVEDLWSGDVNPADQLRNRIKSDSTWNRSWIRQVFNTFEIASEQNPEVRITTKFNAAQTQALQEVEQNINAYVDKLVEDGVDSTEGTQLLNTYIQNTLEDVTKETKLSVQRIARETSEEEEKTKQAAVTGVGELKIQHPRWALDSFFRGKEKPIDVTERIDNNVKVLVSGGSVSQQEEAYSVLSKDITANIKTLVGIVNGNIPKRELPYGTGFELYSTEEKKEVLQTVLKIQGIRGVFTDPVVFEKQGDGTYVTPNGLIYDPKQLNTSSVRILTLDELDSVKKINKADELPESIRQKVATVGWEGRELEFISNQEELYEQLKKAFKAGLPK